MQEEKFNTLGLVQLFKFSRCQSQSLDCNAKENAKDY